MPLPLYAHVQQTGTEHRSVPHVFALHRSYGKVMKIFHFSPSKSNGIFLIQRYISGKILVKISTCVAMPNLAILDQTTQA